MSVNVPTLDETHIADAKVRGALGEGATQKAHALASEHAAAALCDLAATSIRAGDAEAGLRMLDQAMNVAPASQFVFHNMVATLLGRGMLKGDNLRTLQTRLNQLWGRTPWTVAYRSLFYLPTFLNVEFVQGKCNLKCRMCVGTNASGHPDKLSYITREDFQRMLDAAPTINGITLSAGDSEPLLHPEFEDIVDAAMKHHVTFDVFTNGLPLTAKKCRRMISSGVVGMLNFSIDAATPETYRRVRGDDLERLLKKIDMFREMRRESGAELPWLSFSFVAMADNVEELPAFVRLAHQYDAKRVYVEDLIGWSAGENGNLPATEHPRCFEILEEAKRLATELSITLELPERLLRRGGDAARPDDADVPASETVSAGKGELCDSGSKRLSYCGWLAGVWVNGDGSYDPCCLIHGVADMGGASDGPIHKNAKYARVKDQLMVGKVFERCAGQRQCTYVQQKLAAGEPLTFITREDLGELWKGDEPADVDAANAAATSDASSIPLEILST